MRQYKEDNLFNDMNNNNCRAKSPRFQWRHEAAHFQ